MNLLLTGVEYQIVNILLGLKKIAFMNTHLFSCKSKQDYHDEQDSQDEESLACEKPSSPVNPVNLENPAHIL